MAAPEGRGLEAAGRVPVATLDYTLAGAASGSVELTWSYGA